MRPNVLFLFADQLRASSLPLFGEHQVATPNIDRLARQGTSFTNVFSTCPVCTPYRSMLLTGRHPQTTGHLCNFVRTRHDEIGIGDAFARAGYATAWVGKWHLHTGSFPEIGGEDFVPEGRDRLGFGFWRGYNFHMQYFGGWVNRGDWRCEKWEGYETTALNRHAFEFLDSVGDRPFCLFISPHQPHFTPFKSAPDEVYKRLPERLELPANVPDDARAQALKAYRDYLAMVLTVDDMLGEILDRLERTGKADNTLVIFTSDHGTEMGAHGVPPWNKMTPHMESMHVPFVARLPGVLPAGGTRDTLVAPVDLFPTICGLCDVPVPRTVEGYDLSRAFVGAAGAFEQQALFTMNFTAAYNHLETGREWRGVVTKDGCYTRWLDGQVELYDLEKDRLQTRNLAADPAYGRQVRELEQQLKRFMLARGDRLSPCTDLAGWFDAQRRIVRNGYGPLRDPEAAPDWSLLYR